MFIETHCHLDYLKSESLDVLREKIKDAGIDKVITIGVDPENLDKVMDLSNSCKEIYFTQGIHPHDAKAATEVEYEKIATRAKLKKMVAVGEIGLDYHYNHSSPEIQKSVFEKQLQLASDLDLPVVIHTREADEDTRDILKNFSTLLKRKGVVHSFTSSSWLAEFVLREGFYLGFNGIITFKNAQNVQDVVRLTPIEKILFETDSPFLTPIPHRGKENAPYYLPFVANKVGELKNIEIESLKSLVYQNSFDCFEKLKN